MTAREEDEEEEEEVKLEVDLGGGVSGEVEMLGGVGSRRPAGRDKDPY